MPKIFNTNDITFEFRESRIPEFKWHTSPRFGKIVNSKLLQFDVRMIDPGKFSFPYHFHRASEELFMVISGEATLRTPEGFKEIKSGDIIFFEEGPTGAHQIYNHQDKSFIYLDVRALEGIDVTEYPDSDKINIAPNMEIFNNNSKVDYYTGEENVVKKWPKKILRKQSSKMKNKK